MIPGSLQGCRRRPVDRQCTTQHENKTARPSAAAALIVGHGSQQSGRFGVGATPACALPRGCKWRRARADHPANLNIGPGRVTSLPTPKRDQRAASIPQRPARRRAPSLARSRPADKILRLSRQQSDQLATDFLLWTAGNAKGPWTRGRAVCPRLA
jgi:hypothetical protein